MSSQCWTYAASACDGEQCPAMRGARENKLLVKRGLKHQIWRSCGHGATRRTSPCYPRASSALRFRAVCVFLSNRTAHFRAGFSSFGFGRASVLPPWRNEAGLAIPNPGLRGTELSTSSLWRKKRPLSSLSSNPPWQSRLRMHEPNNCNIYALSTAK